MAEGDLEMEMMEKVKTEALKIMDLFPNLPRLIVFDLDYTLWPFFCEFYDEDDMPSPYPRARGILYALKDRRIDVVIASRSPAPDIAKALLTKLGIESLFVTQEIFPSWTDKTEHFQRIHARTGIPFDSMLFFDDEYRNIEAVSKMGVTCIWVDKGVDLEALRKGLTKFIQKSGSHGMNGRN